ncbi:hypothetical protein CAQU_11490 [Corynebacterium aquilae DSM 44791]|uniref:Uncharacterized protein n=1 Tax=Corynebacterium aquilae DSM 44791 TaxID=1431546 RepID=A0A1L7CIG4_9CORY|nr:hypothetical protein CAQU_11490 [Corynebacterium aquilae DSM 44791]
MVKFGPVYPVVLLVPAATVAAFLLGGFEPRTAVIGCVILGGVVGAMHLLTSGRLIQAVSLAVSLAVAWSGLAVMTHHYASTRASECVSIADRFEERSLGE